MKKIKDSIRNKELLAFLFIILIFILLRVALLFISTKLSEARETELMDMKMSALMDIVTDGNERGLAADEHIAENLRRNLDLMTMLLNGFVTEEGYTGPRAFADGFVAELQGDRVLLPPEYEALSGSVTRELIDESLQSGAVMTGSWTDETDLWLLSFGQIAENYVYVDLTARSEYDLYMDHGVDDVFGALESADDTFDGITLMLQEQDGRLQLLQQYGAQPGHESLADLGLTEEMLRSETASPTIDGQEYACSYADFEVGQRDGGAFRIVQLLPKTSMKEQSVSRVRLLRLLMAIIFVAFTVYTTSVQRTIADREVSEEVARHYRPERVRRRMVSVGLLSIVATFLCALMIESLGQMYADLRYGKDTLALFSERLERENLDRQRESTQEEEEWIVYYGENLASLLSAYPELNTRETLEKSCEILDVDYIMLFDSRGRETLCSRDYTGFRLDDERYGELEDFQRLLHGIPSIVHEVQTDGMTGLERQMIGVTLPGAPGSTMHGALLMALLPERTSAFASAFDGGVFQVPSSTRGTVCFAADPVTGEILYSSEPVLLGRTITECGLPESSLQDGFMDFASILGSDYLAITSRDDECIYYYAAQSDAMVVRILRDGAIASLLFAVALALLLLFLLGGYNEKAYAEWEELRAKNASRVPASLSEKVKLDRGDGTGEKKGLLQKLRDFLRWDHLRSGEKVAVILRIGLIVLILCTLDVLHGRQLPNESYDTMLGFLLHGGWMRGLNLFCLYSILMLVGVAYLVNLICSLLLRLSGGLFTGNGETVCRLLYSCIKYVTVFGVLYFSLGYLGFSTGTIVASLGVVSLALSLGAQDLIKDVLSGMAIVFDGSFRVGDQVEINDMPGRVLEIGARSTKLNISGNNTLIINNHEIVTIVNKSKELSEFRLDIRVGESVSLLQLEELLNRELPLIGKKNPLIQEGPYLRGVNGLSGLEFGVEVQMLSLSIGAMIDEKDRSAVELFLNREIRLLFEREGIPLM